MARAQQTANHATQPASGHPAPAPAMEERLPHEKEHGEDPMAA